MSPSNAENLAPCWARDLDGAGLLAVLHGSLDPRSVCASPFGQDTTGSASHNGKVRLSARPVFALEMRFAVPKAACALCCSPIFHAQTTEYFIAVAPVVGKHGDAHAFV